MPVFHTPGCRITGLTMEQASPTVGTNSVRFVPNYPLVLYVNFTIDPAIWFTAGYFIINFDAMQGGDRINRISWTGWTATNLPNRPATNFWLNWSFWRADHFTNGQRRGVFMYKPSVYFEMWGPGGSYIPDEFAVAEEDYYFGIE
jgi:hypothetical protein